MSVSLHFFSLQRTRTLNRFANKLKSNCLLLSRVSPFVAPRNKKIFFSSGEIPLSLDEC